MSRNDTEVHCILCLVLLMKGLMFNRNELEKVYTKSLVKYDLEFIQNKYFLKYFFLHSFRDNNYTLIGRRFSTIENVICFHLFDHKYGMEFILFCFHVNLLTLISCY